MTDHERKFFFDFLRYYAYRCGRSDADLVDALAEFVLSRGVKIEPADARASNTSPVALANIRRPVARAFTLRAKVVSVLRNKGGDLSTRQIIEKLGGRYNLRSVRNVLYWAVGKGHIACVRPGVFRAR